MKKLILVWMLFLGSYFVWGQSHFIPAFEGYGLSHMNLYVLDARVAGIPLEAGDEVAAFDGQICCGVGIVTQPLAFGQGDYLLINASMAEGTLSNGFTPGHPISLRFWDSSAMKEYGGVVLQFTDATMAKLSAVPYNPGETIFLLASVDADVTPSITISPNILEGVAPFEVAIRVTEINQVEPGGEVTVVIPRDSRWSFSWDPAMNSAAGLTVDNAAWNYDDSDAALHIFRSSAVIPAGGVLPFGLRAMFDAGNSRGNFVITSQIGSANGGDSQSGNNADSERIDYFAGIQIGTKPDTANSFKDQRDGKVYRKVKIGNQVWMAENLAYLPAVSSPSSGSESAPFMYVYNYNGTDVHAARATANYSTYGVLYNWPAAMTACPEGWHLPGDAEWTTLSEYLINNGYGYEGSGDDIAKSMAAATSWDDSSITGTPGNHPAGNNSSGLSMLPGGMRTGSASFAGMGLQGYWLSATESTTEFYIWYRRLLHTISSLNRNDYYKGNGYSVRCVKD